MAGAHARLITRIRRASLWFLVVYAAMVVVVNYFGDQEDWSKSAYLVVQMMFANGADKDTERPEFLQVLRLLAPLIIPVFGLVAAVRSLQVRSMLFFKKHSWVLVRPLIGRGLPVPRWLTGDLVVVIGLGAKGIETIRGELASSFTGRVVALEKDPENQNIPEAESLGVTVWAGDGNSDQDLRTVFWKPPARVWVMTSDDRSNLLILDRARKILDKGHGLHGGRHTEIHAHVRGLDERRDAAALLPLNHDSNKVWTNVFNLEENVAAWLFHQHPLRMSPDGHAPRVLLIGLGELGRAIYREMLLMCHLPESGPSLRQITGKRESDFPTSAKLADLKIPEIILIDTDAQARDKLEQQLPFLSRPQAGVSPFLVTRFRHEDAQGWTFETYTSQVRGDARFSHIILALGTEVRNVALAERISAWEQIIGTTPPAILPIDYGDAIDDRSAEWISLADTSGIRVVETRSVYSSYRDWERNKALPAAKRAHRVYSSLKLLERKGAVDQVREEDWTIERCDLLWTECPEHDRRSNLALARYLLSRWSPLQDGSDRLLPSDLEDEDAQCEHRRWMAYQLVENFSYLAVELPKSRETMNTRSGLGIVLNLRKLARVNGNIKRYRDVKENFRNTDDVLIRNIPYILGLVGVPEALPESNKQ